MKLYRFSPIKNERQLKKAIMHVHVACHKLCRDALGRYLPVSGNIGIFCHYPKEYIFLMKLKKRMTKNPGKKYSMLVRPFVIRPGGGVPAAVYTHLYIRKPDPYRHQVGDADFLVEKDSFLRLKKSLSRRENLFARIYPGSLDMVELHSPDVDALGYICTKRVDL